jgi:hypothetical protein
VPCERAAARQRAELLEMVAHWGMPTVSAHDAARPDLAARLHAAEERTLDCTRGSGETLARAEALLAGCRRAQDGAGAGPEAHG